MEVKHPEFFCAANSPALDAVERAMAAVVSVDAKYVTAWCLEWRGLATSRSLISSVVYISYIITITAAPSTGYPDTTSFLVTSKLAKDDIMDILSSQMADALGGSRVVVKPLAHAEVTSGMLRTTTGAHQVTSLHGIMSADVADPETYCLIGLNYTAPKFETACANKAQKIVSIDWTITVRTENTIRVEKLVLNQESITEKMTADTQKDLAVAVATRIFTAEEMSDPDVRPRRDEHSEFVCATENDMRKARCPQCTLGPTCHCQGQVKYGYDGQWRSAWSEWRDVAQSITCSNDVFGDVYKRQGKICVCRQVQVSSSEDTTVEHKPQRVVDVVDIPALQPETATNTPTSTITTTATTVRPSQINDGALVTMATLSTTTTSTAKTSTTEIHKDDTQIIFVIFVAVAAILSVVTPVCAVALCCQSRSIYRIHPEPRDRDGSNCDIERGVQDSFFRITATGGIRSDPTKQSVDNVGSSSNGRTMSTVSDGSSTTSSTISTTNLSFSAVHVITPSNSDSTTHSASTAHFVRPQSYRQFVHPQSF